ncbi:response regulator [Uliginosibacterium aquaticum]|uniref:Response regulator n=1 Tax=Uliginosibacterium aquaticum TaxID=2731212 RepID=A0ABX2IDS6_9RHOO|nr:response regulator [Uliginosibacterium aquaticum]NSL54754.1 response regulator [Uliginosibacterium aquaticum]
MLETPLALVLEDEPQIRSLLCDALASLPLRCVAAGSMEAAREALASAMPQIVVLDLGLPDGDGKTFIGELRAWSSMPVLVLSARSQERDKIEALDAGADDYLIKPFSRGELLARVRALLRRAGRSEAPRLAFGEIEVDFVLRQVQRAGEAVHLTPIEYRLLCALIAGQGKVLTHRQLLREVWGPSLVDSAHYLRIYLGHLRHKLEADPARPRHFLTETGTGYRFVL